MNTQDFLNLSPDKINAIVHEEIAGFKCELRPLSPDYSGEPQYHYLHPKWKMYYCVPDYYNSMDLCVGLFDTLPGYVWWSIEQALTPSGIKYFCNLSYGSETNIPSRKKGHGRADSPRLAILVALLKANGFITED